MITANPIQQQRANRRLALKLAAAALAMFAFGFALVPLYNVFCAATGLNGKTGNEASPAKTLAAPDPRWITVSFNADVMPDLPWRFEARRSAMRVHPGELSIAWFRVRNLADKPLAGRAIPSVSPPLAASHFKKIECFCFSKQELQPGEQRDMPVSFVVKRDLPADVRSLTLSYAFFPNVGTNVALGGDK